MPHATAAKELVVCTVGHSTHPLDAFVAMLKFNDVRYVLDVRTVPRSRHGPQFNLESLPDFLKASLITLEQPSFNQKTAIRSPGICQKAQFSATLLAEPCDEIEFSNWLLQPISLGRSRILSACHRPSKMICGRRWCS